MSDNAGVTKSLLLATSMAVVGSTFQFGYNTGVINAPQKTIEQFFNLTYITRCNLNKRRMIITKNRTDRMVSLSRNMIILCHINSAYGYPIATSTLNLLWGFTVAVTAVGGMIGSLCAGFAADRYGLKKPMLYNNFTAILAALLMGFSKLAGSFEMLIIGRFIIGINSGINMGIAPMYLTEIAPVKYRGVFGTLGQLGVVTSMLLSQVLGLRWLLGTSTLWPLLLALTGVFAVYQLAVIPFCPESPRFLLVKMNKEDEAREALQWLRGSHYNSKEEMNQMSSEHEAGKDEQKTTIKELFTVSHLRQPLIIAIVMQLSQQLSGINAVFYYSTQLFLAAGIPQEGLTTVGVGIVNVIMTIVSLSLIEHAGRRILHLIGLGGMCVCSILLVVLLNLQRTVVISWLTLVPILLFVAFFQTGPGSIPWFITAELFNQSARPAAVSIAGLVNWLGNFTIGLAYPSINAEIGGYTFIIFAVLLAIFWIFTYFRVPETKGKNINEITALFQPDRG
uniref:Major facilitator superfamily (MFS) profile domain-containing protein n=1 Tax=Ciona savignyi TaxID=51511 RepID=H2Y400_CIOSA